MPPAINAKDHEFDAARLQAKTSEMIKAITSPAFVEAMRQLKQTPVKDRLAMGAKVLDPATLRRAGVPLPSDMRITSRYFEPGKAGVIEVGDLGARRVPTGTIRGGTLGGSEPLSWGGCACGGGLTFCGGAGGST
jgi:hypothetical protein